MVEELGWIIITESSSNLFLPTLQNTVPNMRAAAKVKKYLTRL